MDITLSSIQVSIYPEHHYAVMSHRRPRKSRGKGAASYHCQYTKEELTAFTKEEVSCTELIKDISNDLKKFQSTLNNSDVCKKETDNIIALLVKVSRGLSHEDEDIRSKSINILQEVLSGRCSNFQAQIKTFVSSSPRFIKSPDKNVEIVCDFFEVLLERLPDASWGLIPLDEFFSTVQLLSDSKMLRENGQFLSRVQHLVELRKAKKDDQHVKIVQAKRAASVAKCTWDKSEYRTVQILPMWKEISKPNRPYQLRANIVEGSYEDWMDYFDVQFRLLREDFISPLREGISDYLNGKVGQELRNVKVFQDVTIKKHVHAKAGLCHEIKFDTLPFKGYNWEHSKRLIFGSLLCLSPDHFHKEVFFATVSNRDPRKLHKGSLEVMFQGATKLLAHMKLGTKFVMVESLAYFEASRHILRSLQEAEAIETFTRYIISNDCRSVKPPVYLNNHEQTSRYDLQFIVKEQYHNYPVHDAFTSVPITCYSQWPTLEMTELDESQLQAIKMALTQEIAVIQGPPGTGKTYIGLKIVQALLKNCQVWNAPSPLFDILGLRVRRLPSAQTPILVMCFTNHALDQFLEGILAMNDITFE